ncbi:MAG: cadmium-translocating P-type ATPase [Rhodospirillales bacterium]|nr:cadmium-translocating P-type ATPase [Rhodospirillales bacterium]
MPAASAGDRPPVACCSPAAPASLEDRVAALAAAAAQAVEPLPEDRRRLTLVIENLECAGCVPKIERALQGLPGLLEGRVNLTTRRLRLVWAGRETGLPILLEAVLAEGYRLAPFQAGRAEESEAEARSFLLRCLAVAGFAAGNVMLLSVSVWSGVWGDMGVATRDLLHWVSALIALPAVAYAGQPFFGSAAAALTAGRLNMDVPISLAIVLAAAMSLFETMRSGQEAYFDAAVTLLFFLLIGRLLDRTMRGRVRSAAENLLSLKVDTALVAKPCGGRERRAASALRPGDRILVVAGERLPADGRVVEGKASLDVSAMTGESRPQSVGPNAKVHAGNLSLDGSLLIEVTASGERTLLAEVLRLVETAEQGRARYVRLADRVARIYAPAVHLLALGTFALGIGLGASWQVALMNAVAVLIVTCPCALGLAVPAVQVAAVGRLLRGGILVKSGDALERLAEIDHVVFDKTGTLTLGRPQLLNAESVDPADLQTAASLAAMSRHPLAAALVQAAGPVALPQAEVTEHPGAGLIAQTPEGALRLGSAVHVGATGLETPDESQLWLRYPGGRPVCFRFRDSLRPDARAAIEWLREQGLSLEILSGDIPATVQEAAKSLGIGQWRGAVDPTQKTARLKSLSRTGRRVAMAGDGLNDAPALASAHVSLSPAAASEASQVAADLLIQGDLLSPVPEAIAVARRARRLVLQNFVIAIGYNAIAVPLAMVGEITPLLAAVFMSCSSLAVTANALRAAAGGRAKAPLPAAPQQPNLVA